MTMTNHYFYRSLSSLTFLFLLGHELSECSEKWLKQWDLDFFRQPLCAIKLAIGKDFDTYGALVKNMKIGRPVYVSLNSSLCIDFSVLQMQEQNITWVFL